MFMDSACLRKLQAKLHAFHVVHRIGRIQPWRLGFPWFPSLCAVEADFYDYAYFRSSSYAPSFCGESIVFWCFLKVARPLTGL